jgi:predicted dienelactone hydrolase
MSKILILLMFLSALACSDPAGEPIPEPEPPASVLENGPFGVGYRTLEVTYRPAGAAEDRTIEVLTWYPTLDESGEPGLYLGAIEREEIILGASVGVASSASVLVFSHGNDSFPEQSFFMMEFFASHGWIAVSPTHVGNTIFDAGRPRPPSIFDQRPQDVSATLDALYGLPADDPLSGVASDSEVILSGHSFGGYTTLAVAGAVYDVDAILADCGIIDDTDCSYIGTSEARFRTGLGDPRFKVFVPMAPGNGNAFGDAGLGQVEAPVLLMTGLLDKSLPDANHGTPIWDALKAPGAMRLQFTTGAHMTFSDGCELVRGISRDDGCSDDFISPGEAHKAINAYMMAFARLHLRGDQSNTALLSGEQVLSETIELDFH